MSKAEKPCSKCGLVKPLTAFHADSTHADGRKSQCMLCRGKKIETIKLSKTNTLVEDDIYDVGEFGYDDIVITYDGEGQDLTPNPANKDDLRGYVAPPVGFNVKGVSTLFDGDGNIKSQWVKTNKTQDDKYQMLMDAMSTIADKWTGLSEFAPAPEFVDEDLLATYIMGDAHVGLHCWGLETGNDFDLKIAERELYAAVDHLVDIAPAAKNALVVSVGDFFHADNKNSTTTGGTPVDSDGRWTKVLSVGIRLMRRIIDKTLTKHETVTVFCSLGNHDWHTSAMLSICLAQFYENNPRVFVDTSPAKFHWHRFGKNLIGVTHGDTVKINDLGGIMACDRPVDWGETLHRYWLLGHIHHSTVKELHGCVVETFRTLAPGDAWHRGKGYRSGRDMNVLVFHREHGQINRHTVGISQVHSRLASGT